MDLALLVYGISVVSSIKTPLIIGTLLLGISFAGLTLAKLIHVTPSEYDRKYNMDTYTSNKHAIDKWWKTVGITAIIIAFFNVITPTEKTMYIMVGAYAAQKVSENDKVVVLSSQVLKIIESKLDAYIDDAEKEVKKKIETSTTEAAKTVAPAK
jgi:hypothetical protein